MMLWKNGWIGFCMLLMSLPAMALDADGDGIGDVSLVSAGFAHTCALDSLSAGNCWGCQLLVKPMCLRW